MIYNVQHMFRLLRVGLGEDTTYGTTEKDVLINALDCAQEQVFELLLEHQSLMLSTYYDLTLDGSERYYLPFQYSPIHMLVDVTSSDNTIETVPVYWTDRMGWKEGGLKSFRIPWAIRDNYIEFPEEPDAGTIRIWYTRRPVGFLYGTVAAGASTTITFPALAGCTAPTYGAPVPEDDYYIGMWVECNYEVKRITDYVASTRVATIDGTWVTTPTTEHTMSLVSPLPQRFHQLIVDVAINRLKVDTDDDNSLILQTILRDENKLQKDSSRIQNQTPETVRKIRRI